MSRKARAIRTDARPDGTMYPDTTKLELVLRRALRRAGIIVSYRHKCGVVGQQVRGLAIAQHQRRPTVLIGAAADRSGQHPHRSFF